MSPATTGWDPELADPRIAIRHPQARRSRTLAAERRVCHPQAMRRCGEMTVLLHGGDQGRGREHARQQRVHFISRNDLGKALRALLLHPSKKFSSRTCRTSLLPAFACVCERGRQSVGCAFVRQSRGPPSTDRNEQTETDRQCCAHSAGDTRGE